MATIRSVKIHENSRMWAYVEQSDENSNHLVVMGGKQFATQQEAIDFSKGFDPFGYEWTEPNDLKLQRLLSEKDKLQKRLSEIDLELNM